MTTLSAAMKLEVTVLSIDKNGVMVDAKFNGDPVRNTPKVMTVGDTLTVEWPFNPPPDVPGWKVTQ